jgi:hypothetical protein
MLSKIGKKGLIVVSIIVLTFLSIVFLPLIYYLSDNLSETERVKANILLVEGWLPTYAIKMAFNEFEGNGYDLIITSGLRTTSDYFDVFTNGYLKFYTAGKHFTDGEVESHTIEIKAYSSLDGENRANFNVFINDSLVGNFFADKKKRIYTVTWEGLLTAIDSVSIQFLNDKAGDFGDRNLYVREIIFDHKISIPYQLNSIFTYSEPDRTINIKNDDRSYAQRAKNRLLAMGLDSSLVYDIPGEKVRLNRTLTSALAVRDWLKTTDIPVKGINIISLGTHGRRTRMTYNKVFNEKYKIGIISIPDYTSLNPGRSRILKTIRETLGIIYYWIILTPY